MKFVEWDDKFSVGIDEMDSQHKKIVEFTNELFESCQEGKEKADATFKNTIKSCVEYVKVHFTSEEGLLKKHNYSEYSIQKSEHEQFVKKVLVEVENYMTGKNFVPNNFVRFLKNWLLEHIAVSDKKYQKFLNEKGVF